MSQLVGVVRLYKQINKETTTIIMTKQLLAAHKHIMTIKGKMVASYCNFERSTSNLDFSSSMISSSKFYSKRCSTFRDLVSTVSPSYEGGSQMIKRVGAHNLPSNRGSPDIEQPLKGSCSY